MGQRVEIALDEDWLAAHPLTAAALDNEVVEWKSLGIRMTVAPDHGPRPQPQ